MASLMHEVKQPLTSILSNADAGLLMLDGGDVSTARSAEFGTILGDIHTEAQLAASIVDRLRSLVRKQPTRRERLDLSRLAGDTLKLVSAEARRRRIALRTELAASLPPIEADPVSLQQVLLNLVINAMEALDDVDGSRREVEVRTRPVNGAVELAVSDSGPGIPEGRLLKIFDPFFTSLVIAKSIVEEHDGCLSADIGAHGGATFRVSLPCRA
jgi:C4-dicarboxylate-specific signal transduction histidine kinase